MVYAGTGGSPSTTVLGTYTPKVTSSLPAIVLGDSTHLTPTLDLGNVSAVIGDVTFTNNSTVTVDAGSRTLTVGDRLVSWTDGNAPDSSVSFVLCTNGVEVADRALAIKDDFDGRGLYVRNANEPAYAQFVGGQWKYFAEDGTEYEGEWTGGVTSMMKVRFSTVAEYEAVCATNFLPLAFVMATNNFVNTSGGTCDLTTLGTFGFTAGTALDANGGCIKVPTTMAGGATAFTVTNSSVQVGTLELKVSSGDTVNNTVMTITGNIKFVKDGAGTYCADKRNYYSGGTVVNEGVITGTKNLDGSYGFGVWGSSVEIKDGAQALINGVYSVLNGYEVTIEGTGPDGNGAIYGNLDAGYYQTPFIQGLSLSSNATINVVAEDAFNLNNNKGTAYVALNGYELTLADTGRIILWSVNVTNEGSIVASIDPGSSATNICVYTMGNGLSAPLADFTVPSGKAVGGERAYVVSNMTFGGVWSGKSGASLTVLGYYKPTSTATSYPPTTLGDATHLNPALDLSEMSTAYDGSGLSFVDNATVTIKFGERSVQCGTKIVDWTDNAPSNLSGLTFVWGEGNRQYFVVKKSDGLYIHHGFVLLVR